MPEIVYTGERLIDLPQQSEMNEEDYMLIDSETEGLRCIKIESILEGGTQ